MQLFVNDLTVMDFSYLCAQRGMVGESWIVDIILDGGLNDESMIQDFGKVKKELKTLIDEYVDHKLVVPADYQGVHIQRDNNDEKVKVTFTFADNQQLYLYCPPEAYAFVYADKVTVASVKDYLKDIIATHLPDNVNGVDIHLRSEVINTEYYHYTHGLKKHDGNCQRIAHGHRSKVLVEKNGQSSNQWQAHWAERWCDIYIGSQDDCVDVSTLSHQNSTFDNNTHVGFAYEASQGYFEMVIPKSVCEVIPTDSTVECLAQFMFDYQLNAEPNATFTVRAFEGVGKGAIVTNSEI